MDNLVFVYGSLKTGGTIRGLDGMPGAEIVGKATSTYPDYNLLDLGAFPGVIKGTSHIQGEVWKCSDEIFKTLDEIEGYPDFYNRVKTETSQGRAWMYYLEGDKFQSETYPESANIELIGDNTLHWRIFK
jgi:gamma-glutamylcyclotransferase (GGCT)/AIG2-like uncharacterized protein YtfP